MKLKAFSCWPLIVSSAIAQSVPLDAPLKRYEQGDFLGTIEECSRLLQKSSDPVGQIEIKLLRSSAYQYLGQNDSALGDLRTAVRTARRLDRPSLLVRTLLATASAEVSGGKPEASATIGEIQSLGELKDPGLNAELNTIRGELFERQQRFTDASEAYQVAAASARAANRPLLVVRSLNSAAKVLNSGGNTANAKAMLSEVAELEQGLPSSYERDAELIRTGIIAISLGRQLDDPEARLAELVLGRAATSSEQLGQFVNASHAWGNIAVLSEQTGLRNRALEAVGKAKSFAHRAEAQDPLYRWEWLAARLAAGGGNIDEAINEYSSAVENLHSVRSASPGVVSLSFRDAEGRLYIELVDLLLQKAAKESANSSFLLRRARQTMERFKRAELTDYFKDECVEAMQAYTTEIEGLSPTALVIYPIPLPDRLELIFGSSASGLHRVSVPVKEEDLTREVRSFRAFLEKRTTNEYRGPSRKLYEWLITPFQNHSALAGIDTLVFVPDGVLRLIPFSALQDGNEFLISKYAVVVTPSLMLGDSRPLQARQISVLAGGLTKSSGGMSSLPGVKTELAAIKDNFRAKVLADRNFTSTELERELRHSRFVSLHIASHAVISAEADKSYLLMADGELRMERLAALIGVTRFRDQPLELLFLSGCETAVGDERASLGLAGVALGAGAKSAVATLWHVNDDSTAEMVSRFYQLLATTGMTKAKALQEAQKSLLEHTWYRHPGYWSPFLLINNWL